MDKKEQTRLRVQRYRDKKNVTQTIKSVTSAHGVVTQDVTLNPVLDWLIDPVKRKKLGKIIEKLSDHKQLENVYMGCGKYSMPFDQLAGWYEATN